MKFNIPEIPEEDTKNPTVNMLVEMLWNCFRIINEQSEQIALLKDEIAKLKGQKPRPKLPPSKTAEDAKISLVQVTLLKDQSIMRKEKR